ncbi:MAG: GTP 3',8-cyclase MoaA [Phycisphaerales bacterium]
MSLTVLPSGTDFSAGLDAAPPRAAAQPGPDGLAPRPDRLLDTHGRTIRDVRLSITDRCNFRCVYCMDPDHRYLPKQALLSVDEYLDVCRILRSLGVETLRITGGEPTLYRDLDRIISGAAELGFRDIAMTTNGSTLTPARARRYHDLGLHRVTFSLDSLQEERSRAITRARAAASDVVRAIRAAQDAGFDPIKVNAVVLRGVNDDECADFADFAREHGVQMRLIEWMPLDSGGTWDRREMVTADEMLAAIRERHELVDLGRPRGPSQTSLDFGFPEGGPGRVGIIASVTRAFCGACSRLRITADGAVRPCLFSREEWSLKKVLRDPALAGDAAARDDALRQFLIDATWTKQPGHEINADGFEPPRRGMSAIGG